MAFAKILVPLDFSDRSLAALALARRIAEASPGASIQTLYAWESPHLLGVDLTTWQTGEGNNLIERVRAEVERRKDSVFDALGFEPSRRPQFTFTARRAGPAIVELAAREGSDLIVMGGEGLGALAEVVLGSVAHRVMREANCPVITVRG
jgi:nucleotide-binding universal stress UspA family protein